MSALALVLPALETETVFPAGIEGDATANQIVDRASLLKEIRKLGGTMASAQQSRTKAAYLFRDACALGIAHVGVGKSAAGDDAEKVYLELATAHNARGKSAPDFDALPADAKTAKSAISLFRSFGQEAVINQGDRFHALVCCVARDLGTECKLSPYMAMVRANVRVCEAQKRQIGKRMFIATYEDIASWLRNKESAGDTPDVAMDKFIKSMTELSQKHAFGPDVEAAMRKLLETGGQFISDYTQQYAN